MREELSLVVTGSSAIKPAILDDRIEGRMPPLIERLDRLDIVVPVNENCGTARDVPRCCVNDWMKACGNNANLVQAYFFEVPRKPRCAILKIA
jgi:hypothetical protein